jgi:branched-chain amino acid transport system substrate-binding protein
MKKISLLVVMSLVVSGIIFAGGKSEPSSVGAYKIGVFLRFSDEAGVRMRATIRQAFTDINNAGGIAGHPVDVVYYDTEGDAAKGIDAFNRLISADRVLVAIGPTTSAVCLAVVDMAAEAKIPLITPQATNTSITAEHGNEWFFRNSVADIYHSYTLCDYIVNDIKAKRIAFLHETAALGLGQYQNFVKRLQDQYGMAPVTVQEWNEGDVDFRSQLLAAKAANPDVIVIAGHEAELAIVASQRLEVGFTKSTPLLGFSSMSSADFYGVAGDAAAGAIFTTTFSPTDTRSDIADFVKKYTPVLNASPDHNAAQAYDTVKLIEQVLSSLQLGNTSETLAADRAAIRDALAKVKNYVGLTGVTNFGPGGGSKDRDGKTVCSVYQLQPDFTWSVLKAAK